LLSRIPLDLGNSDIECDVKTPKIRESDFHSRHGCPQRANWVVRPTRPVITLDRVLGLEEWRSLPPDDASEFDWLLFRQNQVLRLDQALSGLGRGALQNRLARGRWQRAGRRVVVAHNGPLTRRQRV
jgi:hypothetical protein